MPSIVLGSCLCIHSGSVLVRVAMSVWLLSVVGRADFALDGLAGGVGGPPGAAIL